MSGATLMGVIAVRDADFPWVSGLWTPTDAFEQVAPLFRRELELLEDIDRRAEEYDAAYLKIRAVVTLHYPDGREVPEFLLHIDGLEARFRWSDKPFS